MHLLFNYNHFYDISTVELKVRRLCNIYDSINIVKCLNSIKMIIDHTISFNLKFEKYMDWKMTIIPTIEGSINKLFSTRYVYEYKINTLDMY